MDLNSFKSIMKDMARPNKFVVRINFPWMDIIQDGDTAIMDKNFPFNVKSVKIPEKNVGEIALKHLGNTLYIAGDSSYEPLTITFLNNYNFNLRKAFEAWVDSISDTNLYEYQFDLFSMTNNVVINYKNKIEDYLTGTIVVTQLGRKVDEENYLSQYTFHDIFPTNVSEIELNMDSRDMIEEFTVTFRYSHWTRGD